MKQSLMDRMQQTTAIGGIGHASPMDQRVQRMVREVQVGTHHPVILRMLTVGLLIVCAMSLLR